VEYASISTPGAALVAGLITSIHCAAMCGPLACGIMPVRREQGDPRTVSTVYHLSRLAGYAALGAIAGGLGRAPLALLPAPVVRWLPWTMVIFFLALAFRWDRFLPRAAPLGGLIRRLVGWIGGGSRLKAAAALGLATPLLPCGPLYFLVALALLSGSALRGVEFLLAFGLGTVPLLWVVQSQYQLAGSLLRPRWSGRLRIAFAVAAAVVVAWRLRGTIGLGGPAGIGSLVCF
jgi:sulfite exporter TauE/SafE